MKDQNASGSISKGQALHEIVNVTSKAQHQLKTPFMRFIRCAQLQRASAVLGHALKAARYADDHSRLAAPPSFVPPLQ